MSEEKQVPYYQALLGMWLVLIVASQLWMGWWLWRIDKFLVVLAIGEERLSLYNGPPPSIPSTLTVPDLPAAPSSRPRSRR